MGDARFARLATKSNFFTLLVKKIDSDFFSDDRHNFLERVFVQRRQELQPKKSPVGRTHRRHVDRDAEVVDVVVGGVEASQASRDEVLLHPSRRDVRDVRCGLERRRPLVVVARRHLAVARVLEVGGI